MIYEPSFDDIKRYGGDIGLSNICFFEGFDLDYRLFMFYVSYNFQRWNKRPSLVFNKFYGSGFGDDWLDRVF